VRAAIRAATSASAYAPIPISIAAPNPAVIETSTAQTEPNTDAAAFTAHDHETIRGDIPATTPSPRGNGRPIRNATGAMVATLTAILAAADAVSDAGHDRDAVSKLQHAVSKLGEADSKLRFVVFNVRIVVLKLGNAVSKLRNDDLKLENDHLKWPPQHRNFSGGS
jgi:hypothetical protein